NRAAAAGYRVRVTDRQHAAQGVRTRSTRDAGAGRLKGSARACGARIAAPAGDQASLLTVSCTQSPAKEVTPNCTGTPWVSTLSECTHSTGRRVDWPSTRATSAPG